MLIDLSHYNELVIQNKENNHHLFVHITVSFNYLPILSSSFNNKGNNHIPTRVNNFNPTHPISKTKHEAGVFSLHRFTIKANGERGGSGMSILPIYDDNNCNVDVMTMTTIMMLKTCVDGPTASLS